MTGKMQTDKQTAVSVPKLIFISQYPSHGVVHIYIKVKKQGKQFIPTCYIVRLRNVYIIAKEVFLIYIALPF